MGLDTNDAVFEADPVAVAIKAFFDTLGPEKDWEGTATELKAELEVDNLVNEDVRRSKEWPKSVSYFGTCVERAATLLRERGVDIDKHPTSQRRVITLKATND